MLTVKQIIRISQFMEQTRNPPPSIVRNPYEFARAWYNVDDIHRSINRKGIEKQLGDLDPVPKDVTSREFAEWMAGQYRLAMMKGANLAISEMMNNIREQHALEARQGAGIPSAGEKGTE